jgi:hypothetical protein
MVKFFEIKHSWQQRKKMVGPIEFIIIAYFGSTSPYKNGDETQ